MTEYDDGPEGDADSSPSRSALKREAKAKEKLGERLVALKPGELAQVELPQDLKDAVATARDMKARGALRRQRLLIGKLLRRLETSEIEAALARMEALRRQDSAQFHQVERWRDRLLEEGDDALAEFLDTYPAADRQRLRQLLRQGMAERKSGKSPKAARELFRLLRDILA